MRVWLLAGMLGLGAGPACAGAWPRDPGRGFVSVGFEVASTREAFEVDTMTEDPSPDFTGYRSCYAEYGLTSRLTVGVDAGQDDNQNGTWVGRQVSATMGLPGTDGSEDATDWPNVRSWSGVVFLRYAVGSLEANHRFAVQLGVGLRSYEEQGLFFGLEKMVEEPILRPALAWGAGFDGPMGPGWAALVGSVEFRRDTAGEVYKLDGTLGFKPEGRWIYMAQMQTGQYPGSDAFAKLVPGVVMGLGHGVSLETSVIWGLVGTDTVGARAAIWWEW
jgi:hypothetical protein